MYFSAKMARLFFGIEQFCGLSNAGEELGKQDFVDRGWSWEKDGMKGEFEGEGFERR